METEFAVARKLMEKSELELRTFKDSSHFAFVNEYSGGDVSKIPQEVVEAFFVEPEGEYKLEHDVVENALLPVVDYF